MRTSILLNKLLVSTRRIKFKSNQIFYLLILLLPIQLGLHFWPPFAFVNGIRVDYLAPTIYLTDILVLGILISWLVDKLRVIMSSRALAKSRAWRSPSCNDIMIFLLLLIFLIFNIVFAQNQFLAFFKALKILELTLLSIFIIEERPSFKITVYCLLIAVCYSSIIAWEQFIKQSSINGPFYFLGERSFNISTPGIARADILGKLILRPYATFPHPNVLAGFLTVVLPFLFFFPQITNSKKTSVLYFPLLLFVLATLFITFSRTAWITTLVISLVFFFMTKKKIIKLFTVSAIGRWTFGLSCLLLTFLLPFFWSRMESLFSSNLESLSIREKLINTSIQMFLKYPLTGVGLNNFIPEINHFTRINSYQELQPVHNIFLLITAESGIVGIILFLILIFLIGRKLLNGYMVIWLKQKKPFSYLAMQPFILSFSSLLFLSLFDHYFFTLQQTQLLFTIIIGFILNIKVVSSAPKNIKK